MTMNKIVIIGHHNSGKGALAESLSRFLSLRYRCTSKMVLESFIWPALNTGYATRQACYEDRHQHPALWSELINFHCKNDEARVLRHVMRNCDIYKGLRCQQQFHAGLEQELFDLVIFCESGRQRIDPYLTIDPDYADFTAVINSNEDAASEAARIAKAMTEKEL